MPATDSQPPSTRPVRTRTRAAFVVVALLLCGIVIGAVGDRLLLFYRHQLIPRGGFDGSGSRIVDMLSRRLDLSPAQRVAVGEIVKRHRERVSVVWATVRPQVRSEMEQANREIARVLTEQQREKFRKMAHPRRLRPFGF